MKATGLALIVGLTLGLGAVTASAGVNCDQVRRYLKTGRTPQEIAESMVIDVSEVKKCQEQGEKKEAPAPASTPQEKK
jgi:hypothetical protein